MIYGSVCSGIEAASVAWEPLGWHAAFLSEIDPFARAVLTQRFPEVPLHGDFTTIQDGQYDAIRLLVGGTPCQSFSVAGKRLGLDDPRGNLAIEYCCLARRLRPDWIIWENVPGVLSSNGGRDFGAFLRLLVECGYGFAYRVLDAQYFGVPQRRRRVFVVGYLGDWRPAAAVLFEREGMPRHAKTHEKEEAEGPEVFPMYFGGSSKKKINVSPTLTAHGLRLDFDSEAFVVESENKVRRLTPTEYERLQGFPDGHTDIHGATDAKRYRAIGNSMAVPVMRWIGHRIMSADNALRSVQ